MVYVDDKKKNILILGKGQTGGLYNTAICKDVKHCINFIEYQKELYVGLNYNGIIEWNQQMILQMIMWKRQDYMDM